METLTTVHVSTERSWHGGEEQARLLVEGLARRGHHCLVLARSGGEFAGRLGNAGFDVVMTAGSGRSVSAMWRTRNWLRELRPDVVHFHDPHALGGTGLASWGLSIPARVVTRRVDFPIRSAWKYRHLADRVIAISGAVAEVCRSSGVDDAQLRIVHSGVDPRRARSGERQRGRKALGFAADMPMIVCVATLTDHKGHKYLLEAMPAVLRRFPRARLLLVGDGELRESLAEQAVRLGIAASVQFLGYRSDVPDLLHAADLFVLSSHMEGLCTTLIDAAFAGAPIIATRAGGIPDVLENGNQPVAKLVPPRDPIALAAAITEALADLSALRPMAERARLRVEKLFTADRMVERNLAVYEEILAAKQRSLAAVQRRAA